MMTNEQKLSRGKYLIRSEPDTEQSVTINPNVKIGDQIVLDDESCWVQIAGVNANTLVVHTEGKDGQWIWIYDEERDDVYPIFESDIT